MFAKLISALGGKSESTDWESLLTQVDEDGAVSRPGELPEGHALHNSGSNVTLALMGLAGEEVAARAQQIARDLRGMAENPNLTVNDWNMMIRQATALADMGSTLNAMAEVKLAKVTPQLESVPLLTVVGSVLAKRANHLRRSGIILVPELKAASIHGDPALTRAMVETAVDWGVPFGNRLTVTTGMSPWGDSARLEISSDDVVRTNDGQGREQSRSSIFLWELLVELSTAAGVRVKRLIQPGKATLTIEFSSERNGKGGVEVATEFGMNITSGAAPTVDLVVFTAGRAERMAIDKVLTKSDIKPRYVASAEHLVRECELNPPNALLIEQSLVDRNVRFLIDDLTRHLKAFAVIVLVPEPNIYDMSGPGLGSYCRLSNNNIEKNLREALLFELARH